MSAERSSTSGAGDPGGGRGGVAALSEVVAAAGALLLRDRACVTVDEVDGRRRGFTPS